MNSRQPILGKDYKDLIVSEIKQLEIELNSVKDEIGNLELKQRQLNRDINVLNKREKIYEYVKDYAGLENKETLIKKIESIKNEGESKEEEYNKIYNGSLRSLDHKKSEIEIMIRYLKEQLQFIDLI